jgi:uncharacterized protein YjlB
LEFLSEFFKVFKVLAIFIKPNAHFPNNETLPLLIYKKAWEEMDAEEIAALFKKNGWHKTWTDSIYPFHHYHSNTHEVLAICKGKCTVEAGGENGSLLLVEQGDVLFLPAGVSHKNLESSPDFTCVGAYPEDIEYDMHYGKGERPQTEPAIQKVPLPQKDPITGSREPLLNYWNGRRNG